VFGRDDCVFGGDECTDKHHEITRGLHLLLFVSEDEEHNVTKPF